MEGVMDVVLEVGVMDVVLEERVMAMEVTGEKVTGEIAAGLLGTEPMARCPR